VVNQPIGASGAGGPRDDSLKSSDVPARSAERMPDEQPSATSGSGGRQDAIDVLLDMHNEFHVRFEQIMQEQNPQEAMRMWTELVAILHTHEQMEETYLYKPLHDDRRDENLAEYQDEHHDEVESVEQMLATIEGMDASEPAWRTEVGRIRDTLLEHMSEEENEVFPAVRQAWDGGRLEQAARQMQELRRERLGAA
jgi:hemerythrin superfamily protein